MFAHHWIVADMDGTLTPTPTRAHGKYLSLSHCMATGLGLGPRYRSCLPWLRLFLECGGSLCVVSTAGRRMWTQLYQDLAPSVFSVDNDTQASSSSSIGGGAEGATTAPGSLYLCGFTGAAMFRTRPREVVWADMTRLHPGWQPSPAATATPTTSNTVVVPPAAVGMEEWTAYRQQAVGSTAVDRKSTSVSAPSSTTLDTATYTLACEEGRNAIIRFFEHASYVCGHDVKLAAAFFASCLSTKYHAVFTDVLAQLLAETGATAAGARREDGTVPRLCFAKSTVLSPAALARHGYFLKETGDALIDAQQVPLPDGTIPESAPVAQVVVMGVPMRYFDHIFPSPSANVAPVWQCCPACAAAAVGAKERLEGAGLELKAQPNSVCLHRRGVDKGMCVRWLQAQNTQHAISFDLSNAIAFGDVPESVDRPLTEYPPMQFISLSPKEGAAERLAAMQQQQQQSATSPPPLLYHVGGEEEGTALFLQELITSCTQEAAAKGSDEAEPQKKTWFTPSRVAVCAARAEALLAAELAARCRAQEGEEPPRSTL